MDNLVERPPIRFTDRLERAVRGIADAEKVGHLVVVGDPEDGAGFVRVPHRRMTGADPEVGGRDHHRHRGLPDVVLVAPLRAGDDIAVELRILTARRTDLVADRTRAINRLRAQLLEYFPALERAFDYSKSKAALILLTGYQTPDRLRRAGAARLAAWLRKHTPMRLWPPPSRQPTPSTPWYLDNNWPRPWWLGWPRR